MLLSLQRQAVTKTDNLSLFRIFEFTGERARGTPVACFQQIVWCIQVTGKLGLRVISLQSHQLICNQAIRCTGKQNCPAFADADCYRPWTNFSVHEAVLCCENALRCSN